MKPKNTWKHKIFIRFILLIAAISVGASNTVAAAQISGFVWLDNNADGLQNTGEPGFAQTVPDFGAPNIALYPTGSSELIEFLMLDESSNGHYVFENVPNGNYYVCVSNEFLALGLSVTIPNAGDDAIDSDFDFSPCSYGIEVSGSQFVQRDLGLTGADDPADPTDPGTKNLISGVVWLDDNGDGLRGNTEPVFAQTVPGFGAPNISIYLTGSTEPIAVSALDENSNGRYQFEVPNGDYYICVSNEFRVLGLAPTIQNAGDDSIDSDFDASPCSYHISVTEPDTPQRDLGLVGDSIVPDDPIDPDTGNQISGFVWLDNNADGLQDSGETGFTQTVLDVGSMTVALYPEGSTEFFEVAFLDEDSNGRYLFEDVPAGNYYICTNTVFQLLGLSVTTPNAGDDSIDSDFDFSPCSYGISVTGGQVVMRDLGLVGSITTATGEIELTKVFVDYDDDGLAFGLSNVPGITFELYSAQDGSFIQSAVSSRFSFQSLFNDLPAEDYFICAFRDVIVDGSPVILPVEATIPNVGFRESDDSDFITLADSRVCTETITVTSDQRAAVSLGLSSTIVGPILVDQFCPLDDALRAARWAVPIGFCLSGRRIGFHRTTGTILLQEGSQHSIINAQDPGFSQASFITVKGQGRGAFVDVVSVKGDLVNDSVADLNIVNLTVNIAKSANGSVLNISDSTVLEGLEYDRSFFFGSSIHIRNSTICGVFVESLDLLPSTNATSNPCVGINSSN